MSETNEKKRKEQKSTKVIARLRSNRNNFSWGPLVRVLTSSGFSVSLLKKKLTRENVCTAFGDSKVFLFLDSFMSCDAERAKEELSVIRGTILGSVRDSLFFSAAGGAHPTADPKGTLSLGFDVAVRGEGEIAVRELADAVESCSGPPPCPRRPDWRTVHGACFVSGDRVEEVERAPLIRLDDFLPFCESPTLHPPFEIMRGCFLGCLYCQTPRLHCGKVRFRSLESIEAIVSHYAERFPAPLDIRVIAPNALAFQSTDGRTPNIPALEGLVDIAKRHGAKLFMGSFPSEVRPDFVTEETARILAECDSPVVAIGAQAGSDSELRRMGRGHTVEDMRRAVELLRGARLTPYVDFILCCPGETQEEQAATVSFASELLSQGCHIRLHHFMPLPGTPWATLQPSPLFDSTVPLLNPLLGDSRVEGAFSRQKDDVAKIVVDDAGNSDQKGKGKK